MVRVAIIGGGGAGLTTAWLLEQDHDVVLFEAQGRLGGHAETVDVELPGGRVAVDAGFQFFGPGETYATFNRLLDALGVARSMYPATMSLYRGDDATVLPPFRGARSAWGSLTPAAIGRMLRLRRFAADVPDFLRRHDTSVTMGDYLARRGVTGAFRDEFLVPLLLAFWCVELDEFLDTAAYNTLYYLAAMSGSLRPPRQYEIAGGMRTYIDALTADLARTDLRVCTGVRAISRRGGTHTLEDTQGRRTEADHVIIATSAWDAAELTAAVPELARRTHLLERFTSFGARIAIHGDRRLMPPSESSWSVVNARWDGRHSQLTIWNRDRRMPVFRSWVTYDERLPDPLYAVVDYRHGTGRTEHFDAQRTLKALQGEHGVWLAGMYADDGDSHESAIRSAVAIAEQLAPTSPRLALLRAPGAQP